MPTATPTALNRAARGLLYPSESDAPFEAFAWPGGEGEPTADRVRELAAVPADAPVRAQSLDEFFAELTEGDDEDAAAFRKLRAAVEKHLRHPRVFRFGRVTVVVILVGAAEAGWAGLKTTSVET